MRPLRLVLQAFGPYAGKEEIDFTELGNRNMFVISGKTGAGKTTIFDGISFAIYGKASGEERNGPDLRSHFAAEDQATEVSLQFQLRDKTYYIWRSPMQERKKKSGEGYTNVGAKAELYEITQEGKELLAANVRDVDERIKEIIGLDATQFKQILMIPQGDFKKLLVSESKDKEVILQKLFHTQIYKRMEEKLKEEASAIKKAEEQIQMEIDTLISSIEWRGGHDEEPQCASPAVMVELLEEQISGMKEDKEKSEADCKHKEAWEKMLQKEIFQAKETLAKFDERQKYAVQKANLEGQKESILASKQDLKSAQKASNLEKQEQSYLRTGKRLSEIRSAIETLKQEAVNSHHKAVQCQKAYDAELDRKAEREAAAAKVINLQDLQKDVLAFASFQMQVSLHEKQWKEAQRKRTGSERQLSSAEQQLQVIESQITDAQKATILYGETKHEYEKCETALQLLHEFKQTAAEAIQVRQAHAVKQREWSESEEKHREEKEKVRHLEEALLHSHAALLAAELQEGEPCAVCGSTTHPNPAAAIAVSGESSQKELEILKNKLAKSDQERQMLQQEVYRLHVQVDHLEADVKKKEEVLQSKLSFFKTEDIQNVLLQVNSHLKNTAETLEQLRKQKEALPLLEKQHAELKQQYARLQEQVTADQEAENSERDRFIQLDTKLEGLKERLPEQIRSEQAYTQALQDAVTHRNGLQQALERKQAALQQALQEETKIKSAIEANEKSHHSLQIELNEERELFKQEMHNQGFDTYQLYKEAKKTEEQMRQIEATIDHFEKEYQRVDSLLTNMEYVLKGVEKPDAQALEQQAQQLGMEIKQLQTEISKMLVNIQQNEKMADKLKCCLAKQTEVQEQYEVIGHLADMAKGQNPFRITFERFVLAAFLDDILQEANERLTKMTSGRYQLWRKVDPTRRNVQSGLELTVFDQYTGMERHVKTLSGGESFKASLSLALGLAAVVQQNAGGISLETMFIDEGFGTLDPESLDQAIEALLDIQSGGRLVGIISHVPELKERIDARLEVIGSQSGSVTKFVLS